jgi:hypothetical protein
MFNDYLRKEVAAALKRDRRTVKQTQKIARRGLPIYEASGLSNPPTAVQTAAAIGAVSSLYNGFECLLKDTTSGRLWHVAIQGDAYYAVEMELLI